MERTPRILGASNVSAQHVQETLGRRAGRGPNNLVLDYEVSDAARQFAADRGITASQLAQQALIAYMRFVTSAEAAMHLGMVMMQTGPSEDSLKMFATSMAGRQVIDEPRHPEARAMWKSHDAISGLEAMGMSRPEARALSDSMDFAAPVPDLTRHNEAVQRQEAADRRRDGLLAEAVMGIRSGDPDFDPRTFLLNEQVGSWQIADYLAEVDELVASGAAVTLPVAGGSIGATPQELAAEAAAVRARLVREGAFTLSRPSGTVHDVRRHLSAKGVAADDLEALVAEITAQAAKAS